MKRSRIFFLRERLDVRWGAKKQNDTLSRDYNRPNPLFWPFRAGIPVSLHLFLYDAPLARTSRLLTVAFFPRFSSHSYSTRLHTSLPLLHTRIAHVRSVRAYAKSAHVHESVISTFLEGAANTFQAGIRLSLRIEGRFLLHRWIY